MRSLDGLVSCYLLAFVTDVDIFFLLLGFNVPRSKSKVFASVKSRRSRCNSNTFSWVMQLRQVQAILYICLSSREIFGSETK